MMVDPLTSEEDGTELLLANASVAAAGPSDENTWRLKIDHFQRPDRDGDDRPQSSALHDCFRALGTGDGVAEYYQQQEEMLARFKEMDNFAERDFLPGMSKEERDNAAKSERIAIQLSNLANIFLFLAKVFASIRSGSLAIIASTLDSLLDLLSGFILWFTSFSMRTPNPYLYPIGKKRMQPLGILVFASVMATLGLQILLESVRQLLAKEDDFSLEGNKRQWVVGIMVSVTAVKLFLVIYCRTFTNEIVKAYAKDHFFDVITNSIGLVAAILASALYWWIDPAGAIVVCFDRFNISHYFVMSIYAGSGDGVTAYYQQQNEMLDGFTKMDTVAEHGVLLGISEEEREKSAKSERTAIRISNVANIVLFMAKLYASTRSGSLAIIASTLDSLLDILSGFILWFTAFSLQTPNPYLYPIGKKRMQPLGILVFASVMATLGLQILLESIHELASKEHKFSLDGNKQRWVVGIMFSVTLVKLCLVIYCQTFTNEIIKAYAQDHFFDVITNLIGIIAAVLASTLYWWLDPTGAILLALYTIRTWSNTVLENVNSLVGKTAPPHYLQKLTYLCWNHSKDIRHIDTVRAYTFGSHYFVEVDIVLPSDMPLHQAHDIGESLQEKLESIPDIERAFVHLDYEFTHRPEHTKWNH